MKHGKFKDRAKVYVSSGKGGDGSSAFRREKFVPKGGPSGGDGGRGGHVYLEAVSNLDSLIDLVYSPHQRADHGVNGRNKRMNGKNGADLVLPVPCGTVVSEFDSGEFIGEVLKEGDRIMLARGGNGGLGNVHFKSSVNQAPTKCTPGEEGEDKTLQLELKLVADVGLVGFPNAGKSTLLRGLSNAKPTVASYPFTTLNPIIGTLHYDDFTTLRMADIPGLIEGAHQGVGLGHHFLRHVERTKFLLFVIDTAGVDGRDPAQDYHDLREELRLYRPDLDLRPYAVVANKMDLPEAAENIKEFIEATGEKPYCISADQKDGLEEIKAFLREQIPDIKEPIPVRVAPASEPENKPDAEDQESEEK